MSSDKITLLIADDEAPARKRLRALLVDKPRFRIVDEAENGDQVVAKIIENNPQVVFLDINMPGASVFSTIPSLKDPPLVVFQTAYSEYGAKAFDIDAIDYLLKPVSRERFDQALKKIETTLGKGPLQEKTKQGLPRNVLSIKSGETIRVVKIASITRISFENGFSYIHLDKEKLYSDKSLNAYEEQLHNMGFYRISRNDIINLAFIYKLHPLFKGQYMVEMQSGEKLTVSRRRIQGLKERIE